MSVKLTLQINSLPALEAIMKGADTELSIEIRQAVATAFAERWLKPLSDNPTFQQAVREIQAEIRGAFDKSAAAAVGKISRSSNGRVYKVELNPETRDHIKSIVAEMVSQEVHKELQIAREARERRIHEAVADLNIPDMVAKIKAEAMVEAKKEILKQLKG